jgi:hypothetical protein
MIRTTIRSKLFVKIWLRSLLWGVVLGIVIAVLVGALTGAFASDGGDDMAGGVVFFALLFGIGNLVSYIVAILMGKRFVRQEQQNVRLYIAKVLPLSIGAFLLSISILFPLLPFGSFIAAFIVTFSIGKIPAGPGGMVPGSRVAAPIKSDDKPARSKNSEPPVLPKPV